MAVVKNLMVRVGADFSSLISGSKQASKATNDWASKTKSAFASVSSGSGSGITRMTKEANGLTSAFSMLKKAGAVLGVGAIIKEAFDAGAETLANDAQMAQIFGGMVFKANKSLSELEANTGFTAASMKKSFAGIGAFAKASGMDTAQALSLSERAMAAAADSAAFYDRTLDDTVESLQSFLKGNYANDAALGLSSTETTRNAMAMQLYGTEFRNLTEVQKQWTLLAQIEQANALSGALGQAARESNNWSTNIQRLKSLWHSLLGVIGKGFIAIANPVVSTMNNILSRLVSFANSVSDVFSSIFGTAKRESEATLNSIDTSGLSSGIDEALSGIGSSAGAASGGVDDTTKSIKGATEAAKELQRATMGFDEMQKLPSVASAASGSSGGGGSGGSGGGSGSGGSSSTSSSAVSGIMDEAAEKTQKFSGIFADMHSFLTGLDWSPMESAWGRLKEGGQKVADVVGGALLWGYDNVLKPLAKWGIEEAVPATVSTLGSALQLVADAAEKAGPWLQIVWDKFLAPMAKEAGENIVNHLKGIDYAIRGIDDLLNGDTAQAVEDFSASWDYLKQTPLISLALKISHTITDPAKTAMKWVEGGVEQGVSFVISMATKAGDLWSSFKSEWGTRSVSIYNSLASKASSLWSSFKEGWGSRSVSISNSLTNKASTLWTNFSTAWGTRKLSITNSLANTASDLWTKFKNGWSGKKLKLTIEYVKATGVKGAVVKALGLSGWPTIKFAARGGIVNAATLLGSTVVGEAGREAIIPLENHTEWMDKVALRIADRLGTSQGNRPVQITVISKLDGREVARNTVYHINEQARATGYNPLAATI